MSLVQDGKNSVALLEYGDSDRSDPRDIFLHMPTALAIPMNMQKYNWGFESEAEPELRGRRLHCPRGKVLGGSSSINGMVFVRGHPRDFDHWEEEHGATSWSYLHTLLPTHTPTYTHSYLHTLLPSLYSDTSSVLLLVYI
jgi:choline dehydrogenase